jgi:UDP-2,3-diacylglucosamine hydrolase
MNVCAKFSFPSIDFFIFGHRHVPLDIQLNDNSRYINTGNWLTNFSYAVFENNNLAIKYFDA